MKETIIQFGLPILTVILTIVLATIVNKVLLRIISKASQDLKNDSTSYNFLRHVIVALVYLVGFGLAIYFVPKLRNIASGMLAGAGIVAVAIGFASQHALSNVISGLFIVMFKPFRINDRLALRTFQGIVEDITLRHTVIRDFENKRIIIPNSVISDEILVNADFAEERICKWIDVGISYDSDIDLAKSILADEILNHPLHIDPRSPEDIASGVPEAIVRVISLGDSMVQLRGWAWAKDAASSFQMSCDLLESIKKRFDREGVSIPYPHRTVYIRSEAEKKNT